MILHITKQRFKVSCKSYCHQCSSSNIDIVRITFLISLAHGVSTSEVVCLVLQTTAPAVAMLCEIAITQPQCSFYCKSQGPSHLARPNAPAAILFSIESAYVLRNRPFPSEPSILSRLVNHFTINLTIFLGCQLFFGYLF